LRLDRSLELPVDDGDQQGRSGSRLWKHGASQASRATPLTAIRFGEIAQEAGLPEGVLNIVTELGPGAGSSIAEHPDIDRISFTGRRRWAR
jgi:hypothetical protein